MADPETVAFSAGAMLVASGVWRAARWAAPLMLPSLFGRPAPPAVQAPAPSHPDAPPTRAEFDALERRVSDLDDRIAKELGELRADVKAAALNTAKTLGILEGMDRR